MLEGIIQISFRHPHTVLSHGIEMLTDAAMMRDKMARCDAICTAAAGYSAALHPPRGVGVGTPRCRDRRTAAPRRTACFMRGKKCGLRHEVQKVNDRLRAVTVGEGGSKVPHGKKTVNIR